MHAVNVIALDDIGHHRQGVGCCGGLGGVKPKLIAITANQVGLGAQHMRGADGRLGSAVSGAVGVEPGVQFQTALVRFTHPQCQGVVSGLGGAPLFAAEPFAPGLQSGRVQSVGSRAHLQHDGVQAQGLRFVEQKVHFDLLLRRRQL